MSISFDQIKDIILKHTNSRDLKDVLTRIKSASKSLANEDYGNDVISRLNYRNHFIFNKTDLISNNTLYSNKSKINKLTYKTLSLIEIINKIHNAGFRFIINENGKSFILYDKGQFIFDCFFINDKYYNYEGYIKCKCYITIDDSSAHNLNYKIITNPSLRSNETIDEYMNRVDGNTYIHQNNSSYSNTFEYINKEQNININSFRYVNKNKSFITLNVE